MPLVSLTCLLFVCLSGASKLEPDPGAEAALLPSRLRARRPYLGAPAAVPPRVFFFFRSHPCRAAQGEILQARAALPSAEAAVISFLRAVSGPLLSLEKGAAVVDSTLLPTPSPTGTWHRAASGVLFVGAAYFFILLYRHLKDHLQIIKIIITILDFDRQPRRNSRTFWQYWGCGDFVNLLAKLDLS